MCRATCDGSLSIETRKFCRQSPETRGGPFAANRRRFGCIDDGSDASFRMGSRSAAPCATGGRTAIAVRNNRSLCRYADHRDRVAGRAGGGSRSLVVSHSPEAWRASYPPGAARCHAVDVRDRPLCGHPGGSRAQYGGSPVTIPDGPQLFHRPDYGGRCLRQPVHQPVGQRQPFATGRALLTRQA